MNSDQLLESLKENPFLLAPMAGITDMAFRSYMKELGCGVITTELISSNGLKHNSQKTIKLMSFSEKQRPVGVQIFGETPENMADAARFVEEKGADFVDINFGCPVPKVVKKGAGSAMLKDLVAMAKLLRTVKSAVSIPVTIKIRTGWSELTKNAHEVAQLAYDEGITWVSIHGRTRSAGYKGKADWEYLKQVKEFSPIPIIGNGDIASAQMAVEKLREGSFDAVMIGRGCLKNPWIFVEARAQLQGHAVSEETDYSFISLFHQLRHHLEAADDERWLQIQLKKLGAWYSAGFPGSAKFRGQLFKCRQTEELFDTILNFYNSLDINNRLDTSQEPFLMGGHG